MNRIQFWLYLTLLISACKPKNSDNSIILNPNTHSFSNLEKVTTTHLNWDAQINFDLKQVSGTAT